MVVATFKGIGSRDEYFFEGLYFIGTYCICAAGFYNFLLPCCWKNLVNILGCYLEIAYFENAFNNSLQQRPQNGDIGPRIQETACDPLK